MNCNVCQDSGWEIIEGRGATRCGCRLDQRQIQRQPIDSAGLSQAVKTLAESMPYFPSGQYGQTLVGDALASMCGSIEELRYVVRRAVSLYRSWDRCGVPGLRQILCSKYRPADGITIGGTDSYPEGLPPETGMAVLDPLPPGRALAAGRGVSNDGGLDRAVRELAAKKSMPKIRQDKVR